MTRRRKFQRPLGQLRYRKMFVIAAEGGKTEPQYFAIFNNKSSVVHVKCIKGRHASSPPQVLRRLRENIEKEGLRKSDEAWLVVDKNGWTDEQLEQLHQWSQGADNYGFALSNPKFEYWLLLHFENGDKVASSRDCSDRLKRYLPSYNKRIDKRMITQEMVDVAVQRAKHRDNPPCLDWPRTIGSTTVYRLVENILRTK